MKRLLHIAAIAAALVPASGAFAQTYQQTTPQICSMASVYPIQSFSEFACRGVYYDGTAIQTFWTGNSLALEFFTPAWALYGVPQTEKVTAFSLPSDDTPTPATPGTFAFSWTGVDNHGVARSGSISGTWVNIHVCGGRGCYWWAPKIMAGQFTVSQ